MLRLLYSASEKREANPLSSWKVTPQNHSESIILKHDVWSSQLSTTSKLICNEESVLHMLCLGVSFHISDPLLTHNRFWFHICGCSVCANMSQILYAFLLLFLRLSPSPVLCYPGLLIFILSSNNYYCLRWWYSNVRKKGVALDGWKSGDDLGGVGGG